MSLAAKRRAGAVPVMNVTPLVDVVLVLLIIFMVVIPMLEKTPNVTLPDIFNPDEDPKGKTDPFSLTVTSTGEVYFEKEKLTEANVETTLRKANKDEPSRRIVLRADRTVPYADIRKLFKTCQSLGFPGISMRVNALKETK